MMRMTLIALVPTSVARSARGALAMSMRGRKLYAAGWSAGIFDSLMRAMAWPPERSGRSEYRSPLMRRVPVSLSPLRTIITELFGSSAISPLALPISLSTRPKSLPRLPYHTWVPSGLRLL